MTGFILKRLLWMVLTLWVVFTVSFFLMRAVPGGPFDSERALDPQMAERILKEIKALGFRWVSLDLEGYRSGSLNEVLPLAERKRS